MGVPPFGYYPGTHAATKPDLGYALYEFCVVTFVPDPMPDVNSYKYVYTIPNT